MLENPEPTRFAMADDESRYNMFVAMTAVKLARCLCRFSRDAKQLRRGAPAHASAAHTRRPLSNGYVKACTTKIGTNKAQMGSSARIASTFRLFPHTCGKKPTCLREKARLAYAIKRSGGAQATASIGGASAIAKRFDQLGDAKYK